MGWRLQRTPSAHRAAALTGRILAILAALACAGIVLAMTGRAEPIRRNTPATRIGTSSNDGRMRPTHESAW